MSIAPQLRNLNIDLPACPSTLVKLSLLMADEHCSTDQLAALIETERSVATAKAAESGKPADIAAKMGVSPQQAGETLAGLLPEAIDRLTPGGQIDGADDLLSKLPGGVGDMIGGFLKR